MSDKPQQNTDRQLWQETPDDYYSPSIHVTAQGAISIQVGGLAYSMGIRDWYALAVARLGKPVPQAIQKVKPIALAVADEVALAAKLFCENVSEDSEDIPQVELKRLNAALDKWEKNRDAAFADNPAPIDMLLFCPKCNAKHIDRPQPEKNWDNPPHRSHECQFCGTVWRPSDSPTNGVAFINTRGKRDIIFLRSKEEL